MSLDDLPHAARRSLELAIEALSDGSFPVGAVIVDRSGRAVAEGRNRIHSHSAPERRIRNTAIAHAEIDALCQLPLGRYRDHILHTSLEPCMLCRSAAGLSRIGAIHFVGRDALCEGLDGTLNAHTARLAPKIIGPALGDAGLFASLLPLAYVVRSSRDPETLRAYELLTPSLMDQARRLVASRQWPTPDMDLQEAMELVLVASGSRSNR
jgi:tRNA(Arg) A34 adenosine deaminase TadA